MYSTNVIPNKQFTSLKQMIDELNSINSHTYRYYDSVNRKTYVVTDDALVGTFDGNHLSNQSDNLHMTNLHIPKRREKPPYESSDL
jgi:hypothetical protein